MTSIKSGHITLFYLFDVAETIALDGVRALVGTTEPSRLATKPRRPSYVQYQQPPLAFTGESVGTAAIADFTVRVKLFEYGVASLALTRPFAGTWEDLIAVASSVVENSRLADEAEACCRQLTARLAPALNLPPGGLLSEDYAVFTITSYLANDVVIPTWNTALVYDDEAGADGALEIIEFANSQLLEFRYFDDLLDTELTRIYGELQRPRPSLLGARRQTRAAQQAQALLIDLHELTDHTENALKFVGDVYAARLFTLVASRLALEPWKASVQEKLRTLEQIRRFAVEQTSMARGQFLELTIVLILILELVLFFLGIMK